MRLWCQVALAAMVPAMALAWTEPARGSKDRASMLDAIRPMAEWRLGAPVEFVVDTLRVAGDHGFAVLYPQRPGGIAIDLGQSPLAIRDGWFVDEMDGARIDVLFRRSGGQWVAVLYEIGATDAWYVWEPICAEWWSVLSDRCGQVPTGN